MKALLTMAAVAALGTTAFAGDMASKGFESLDTNGDGVLSRAEVEADAVLKERFESLDTNADGQIDATEYEAKK